MLPRTEFQGFLSIKIPPKMRGFLPWKTWKRQWISVRCLPAGGVDLVVGRNSQNVLHISPSDIIVRTHSRSHLHAFGVYPRDGTTANFCLAGTSETDSQKWIATLRKLLRPPLLPVTVFTFAEELDVPELPTNLNFSPPVEEDEFAVSVIDNVFTRSSGFPGLYGILRASNMGITITDPFTSKIRAFWQWQQLSHLYIRYPTNEEDCGRICTIITSREFPTGIGKIHLFCLDSINLIRSLTRGEGSNFIKYQIPLRTSQCRHHTFSYDYRSKEISNGPISWLQSKRRASVSDHIKYGRRLSKSEGNLLSLFDQVDSSSECSDSGFIHDFYNTFISACFSDNEDKSSGESEGSPNFRKVGPCIAEVNVINISDIKYLDSTHVYQELQVSNGDNAVNNTLSQKFSPRRQSGASVASGVYEEIDELSLSFTCKLRTVHENESDSPPPLPPRRDSFTKRLKSSSYQKASTLEVPPHIPNKFISKSAGSTPLPSPPSLSRAASSTEFPATTWPQEEMHYLPMNSYRKHIENFNTDQTLKQTSEEQHYVVMSSFITDQT